MMGEDPFLGCGLLGGPMSDPHLPDPSLRCAVLGIYASDPLGRPVSDPQCLKNISDYNKVNLHGRNQ